MYQYLYREEIPAEEGLFGSCCLGHLSPPEAEARQKSNPEVRTLLTL